MGVNHCSHHVVLETWDKDVKIKSKENIVVKIWNSFISMREMIIKNHQIKKQRFGGWGRPWVRSSATKKNIPSFCEHLLKLFS